MTASELGLTAANLIDGKWTQGSGSADIAVFNPATGNQITEVRPATIDDAEAAVAAASRAFIGWSSRPLNDRVRYLYKMRELLAVNLESLARTITIDQGKTLEEARGEVARALDFLETAIAAPMLYHSQSINITTGLDARRVREPLGVCVAVTPSNFPVMNTVQFSAWALVTGNTLVIKASEQDPVASSNAIRLLHQAGLPDGVLSLVHGRADIVKHLISHPSVRAVSCITSSPTARAIYATAAAAGKRVQANGGAKNPIVVASDADLDKAATGIISSAYGMAGQRCLAGSRLVVLSDIYDDLMERVVNRANELVVGSGLDDGVSMGPVVSAGSKGRILRALEDAQKLGATFVLDGRNVKPSGGAETENGYFVGPTLVDNLDPTHEVERQELFGPVVVAHRVTTLDAAIALSNDTEFGNAASIYTTSGAVAAEFERRVRTGNVGINAFPAPPANVTMGGYGLSFYGDSHVCGDAPLDFFTDHKLVVTRW
ncbi:aldehyde dehydrogenase family protein [Mycobacterium malmoense]|uniref:methylmalonate-semialdehyde dehydrogenase (CoA acylating) n=1 Tax=Mycobacterium malmoense TaxID=1780 RepID=A0ABX3SS60_MYCMA|nr:aldehyde dehydrogenase family protein [Mycobacterium malmoense]ORA82732.1 methylmalonate-semialdehyde dehydrogenase [Mycobacterium malmoense]QZA16267.1 aldehyde dehydrogenase family protein [Mycobacterium malmoense]UNB93074.1 aldehyde dehydrogenase family protein [Mycobacterium malmoense]